MLRTVDQYCHALKLQIIVYLVVFTWAEVNELELALQNAEWIARYVLEDMDGFVCYRGVARTFLCTQTLTYMYKSLSIYNT